MEFRRGALFMTGAVVRRACVTAQGVPSHCAVLRPDNVLGLERVATAPYVIDAIVVTNVAVWCIALEVIHTLGANSQQPEAQPQADVEVADDPQGCRDWLAKLKLRHRPPARLQPRSQNSQSSPTGRLQRCLRATIWVRCSIWSWRLSAVKAIDWCAKM